MLEKILTALVGAIVAFFIFKFRYKFEKAHAVLKDTWDGLSSLEIAYNNFYNSCSYGNFEKAQEYRQELFKLHRSVYNNVYYYFDEVLDPFTEKLCLIAKYIVDIEEDYKKRFERGELFGEDEKHEEFLYTDQHCSEANKLLYELYEIIKIKQKNPLRRLNIKIFNLNEPPKYNPFFTRDIQR